MPFKLKLKKTRQYNVASKNLFVISVELLDGGVADCTLSVDSTGQECLDNVCQRQGINQPEFFGLRYVNRSQQPRWVQLERPLKRQLDKYASSHQLYLRVMYYVISGTNLITDEVTRYHYFLQLKNDLIEGRIICDCQQAVVLASYSRQAEYGNHDRERHTVEYLKNLLVFPKQMLDGGQVIDSSSLAETGRLEWLTSAVIQHHMSLHNMSQAQAEEGFISVCQQLRGYGQEMFLALEQRTQQEVTIAVSLTGVTVLPESSDNAHFYRWMDITNVINHKLTFSIECAKPAESASFVLSTPEDGKYVWRLCVQQHTFYMRHQRALSETKHKTINFQVNVHGMTSLENNNFGIRRVWKKTNLEDDESGTKHTIKLPLSNGKFILGIKDHSLSESREELEAARDTGSESSRLQRAHSTSCLELENRQPRTIRRQLLPTYRPAPDYETAIQQKYQQQRADAQLRFQNHHAHTQMVTSNAKPLVYGSHPDIHRIHYPDVTRHTVSVNQGVAATDDYAFGLKYMGHNSYAPFAVNPNVQTELNPQLHYVNVYKPPPPYPSNGLASNSTPDLAVASQALNYHRGYINSHVSGSSPDLVSNRSALNRQYLGYINTGNVLMNYGRPNIIASTHGTYNNLSSVLEPNPHIIMDPHHISDNIQKVYDERGNIMYSMPMHRVPYQRHIVLPQTQQITKRNDQEPIYENVPLNWRDDKVTIRDRAQSLTTTDEIARLNERNSSNPTINYNKPTLNVPNFQIPPIKIDSPDSHYVNAQVIKGVRESSMPKDLNVSNRSINKDEFENVTLSVDRMSINEKSDETPYQSLSTHKVINNNIFNSKENVTSISVPDIRTNLSDNSNSSVADSALTTSVINSTYSTDLETSANTTKSSVSSKEKKRRRWGVFMGRSKDVEVKSATLGRDRAKVQAQPVNKHRWSTGLPKFQPLPPSISKETLCQLLERKMTDNQLSFAFEQIPKGREKNAEMTTGLLPENAHLNGYSTDHLPYEDNRVRLPCTPANPQGYINASHITMTVGSSQRFYVIAKVPVGRAPRLSGAAPGGVPGAAARALWQAVWLLGARVVAVLGDDVAKVLLDDEKKGFGDLSVQVESTSVSAWGATRRAALRRERRTRHVWLVEARAPDDEHALKAFLSELSALRLASASEVQSDASLSSHTAPLVFCCSQGAGRSGTCLAADLLLHILDSNQELDIPRTISLLHQQRANLIQNVQQYKLLHQILLLYLKQSRLI